MILRTWRLDGVMHKCNPSTQETKVEDHKFKSSLGYIVKINKQKTTLETLSKTGELLR
jgi:hypothetical protein